MSRGQFEENDGDLQTTALRETHEEVGVPATSIQVVRQLTQIYIPPSNFMVSPFMGILDHTPRFIPDPSEVQDVIEVPLVQLLDQGSLITRKLSTSYARSIEVPAFDLQGHVVWGATAMMLNEAREMLSRL
ncbi:CoA pyrophosphatase [Aureitalea marina]|uniref:NUDIX hydrolase n=1 Tax=Aureitalea marina TaxID=930804 RepID=UPI0031833E9D